MQLNCGAAGAAFLINLTKKVTSLLLQRGDLMKQECTKNSPSFQALEQGKIKVDF